MICGIERHIWRQIAGHPVSVNSPQHRGRGEIRNQQFINKSKRRSDIGAVNGNCTIRCKFFVQNSLANSNAEFFCIRQAQSVPLRGRHNSIQLCKQIGCLLPVGLNAHTGGIVFLVDFCTFVNNLLLDWNGRNRNQHLFIKRCRYTTMSTCSSHCILSSFTHRSLVEEKKEKLSENFACMASKSMELATTKSDTVRQSLRNCAFSIFHAWGYFRNNEISLSKVCISSIAYFAVGTINFSFNKSFAAYRGHIDKRNKQIVRSIMNLGFWGIQITNWSKFYQWILAWYMESFLNACS